MNDIGFRLLPSRRVPPGSDGGRAAGVARTLRV